MLDNKYHRLLSLFLRIRFALNNKN